MRNRVQVLTDRGEPCSAEDADTLRDELQRLYLVASNLRQQVLKLGGEPNA